MKFLTIKNTKNKILYSVKIEGDTCVIYLFDDVSEGRVIRAIHCKKEWLIRKLLGLR